MPTWINSIFFLGERSEKFRWWQHVIDYPHKSFDNCHRQALELR